MLFNLIICVFILKKLNESQFKIEKKFLFIRPSKSVMDEKTIVVMEMGLAKLPNPFFDLFCYREGINPFQILSPIVFQLY